MSYEWHVNLALKSDWRNLVREAREELGKEVEKRGKRKVRDEDVRKRVAEKLIAGEGPFGLVSDLYARVGLLAQSLGDTDSEEWNTESKGVYTEVLLANCYTRYIKGQARSFADLCFATPALQEYDLVCLPEHSFFLFVPFTLAAPYISKDDEPFYVHENPLRKDWVLRVPMVGSTSWKGSLRAALRWTLRTCDEDPRVVRLLGNPKGEQEGFRRGRVSCFPTFFDALEVEVINPHARKTGAGTLPIHLEAVPKGGKGTFALLYTPTVPDDPAGPLPAWEEVLLDLELVGQAVYALLAERGWGAKTASGMGRAEEGIPGAYLLVHRWIEVPPESPPSPLSEPPPKVFRPDSREFVDESGRWPHYQTNEELDAHISGKKAQSRYKRQRMAYREWRGQRERWEAWEQEVAALSERVERRMLRVDLTCLGDLKDLRRRVEAQVRGERGG